VCQQCPSGYNTNAVPGSSQCNQVNFPFLGWVAIFFSGIVLVIVAVVYQYRSRQKDQVNAIELNQMNQSLLQQADDYNEQLQSATNPLEQSQYNIPSHDLELHQRIASGGNGWIYKATMGATTLVAAKEIMSATIDPEDIREFEHEAKMLTQLNHPQVLRVFGFCIKTAEETKDNQERRYIVTEFAHNGSLENVIKTADKIATMIGETKADGRIQMPFTKMNALEWAVQIASGTAFLHRKGYVHRDMKPQNILLNKSNDALVADLGTVRRPPSGLYPNDPVAPSNSTAKEKEQYMEELCQDIDKAVGDEEQGRAFTISTTLHGMTDMKGTPMYMAPEQFQDPNYSYPVDVWAYGLTLVRLFTLKWPYPLDIGLRQLVLGIARNELFPEQVQPHEVPHEEVLRVITDCLQRKASKRPTMKEVEKRLTMALKELVQEAELKAKQERRRIKDIKKERRIKRRQERENR
jgi:serine/threonine protein kinase